MDTGVQVTIGLALASAGCWLAYNHPKSFSRLGYVIIGGCLLIGLYQSGIRSGLAQAEENIAKALMPEIERKKLLIALIDHEQITLSFSIYLVGIMGITAFFLSFPLWLDKDEK